MILDTLLAKVIGTQNERELKRLRPLVAEINEREAALQALADDQLKARTAQFRERVANGESLDDILRIPFGRPEASHRALNMRHFDVQLIGGMVCTAAASPR